jgi:hypothetical protein
MSIWTHIAAIIRVDSVGHIVGVPDGTVEVGIKSIVKQSPIPSGTEGPAHWRFMRIESEYSPVFGNIVFWGDLRDYDDAVEIQEWLHDIIKTLESGGLGVRGFAGSIEVEGAGLYAMYMTRNEQNETVMRSQWIETPDVLGA